ncbi:uncharacterized protein ATNIH1004_005304 [Aspergillus tanneri]|uniref:Uncharacterized protein n=1 Tax=Aspergillus tanneri TaxID=1220188 RepID=A0A5M9MWY3_9EURO|nr:uncharacterized protein ATNIH1004_005304 [Aspergillus tanneri]KAA8649403.1 hypothetical protein ATNIH1004_005304 [Aspergillus tanneri]
MHDCKAYNPAPSEERLLCLGQLAQSQVLEFSEKVGDQSAPRARAGPGESRPEKLQCSTVMHAWQSNWAFTNGSLSSFSLDSISWSAVCPSAASSYIALKKLGGTMEELVVVRGVTLSFAAGNSRDSESNSATTSESDVLRGAKRGTGDRAPGCKEHGERKRLGGNLIMVDALVCHTEPLDRFWRWRDKAADVFDEGLHHPIGEVDVRDQDVCVDTGQLQSPQARSCSKLVKETWRGWLGGISRGVLSIRRSTSSPAPRELQPVPPKKLTELDLKAASETSFLDARSAPTPSCVDGRRRLLGKQPYLELLNAGSIATEKNAVTPCNISSSVQCCDEGESALRLGGVACTCANSINGLRNTSGAVESGEESDVVLYETLQELLALLRLALNGSLREEEYAMDGTAAAHRTYYIKDYGVSVKILQQHGISDGALDDQHIQHGITLKMDDYGNILSSVQIYGRAAGKSPLDGEPKKLQETMRIALDMLYTSAVEDSLEYHTPLQNSAAKFELFGIAIKDGQVRYQPDDFILRQFSEVPSEGPIADDALAKRVMTKSLTLFRKNDPTAILGQDELDFRALEGISYTLSDAGTPCKVSARWQSLDPRQSKYPGQNLQLRRRPPHPDLPKATSSHRSGSPTLMARFARIELDSYLLTFKSSTDALGNVSSYVHGYRIMKLVLETDPNGNRSAYKYDCLKRLIASSVTGKANEQISDSLQDIHQSWQSTKEQILPWNP